MYKNYPSLSGPRYTVETSTTNSAVGASYANLEITHDHNSQVSWVRHYAAGRHEMQHYRLLATDDFLRHNQPAEAIMAARIASEIPYHGQAFMFNQGVVSEAMTNQKSSHPLLSGGSIKAMFDAMATAFDTPPADTRHLRAALEVARTQINGTEIEMFAEAVDTVCEREDFHAAGVGALELAAAYEAADAPDEAVQVYAAATHLLSRHLEMLISLKGEPGQHTAEADTVNKHLAAAHTAITQLLTDADHLDTHDVELLKASTYYLDDTHSAPLAFVRDTYRQLGRVAKLRERLFYRGEARGIQHTLNIRTFFENHPNDVLMGAPHRRDRTAKRPPATPV